MKFVAVANYRAFPDNLSLVGALTIVCHLNLNRVACLQNPFVGPLQRIFSFTTLNGTLELHAYWKY